MSPRRGPIRREPTKYVVGVDVTPEKYEELLVQITNWFAEWRDTKEPAADARMRLKCCLEGKTLDGKPWFTAATTTFEKRVAMLCRYDAERMQPIKKGDPTKKSKKDRDRRTANAKRIAQTSANDPLIPELTRKELNPKVNYGDDPHVLLTHAEEKLWNRLHDDYCEQFPELKTVNAQAELAMLCDLHVVHERNRLKLLKGESVDPVVMGTNTKHMIDLKKALGIHPEQLAKRIAQEQGGSIGEAVQKLSSMNHGMELRERAWAEMMVQLYQMSLVDSPRQDMGGKQLDPVTFYGYSKCRTCACANCGVVNAVGFRNDEFREVLKDRGHLVEVPEIKPGYGAPLVLKNPDAGASGSAEGVGDADGGEGGVGDDAQTESTP